MRTIHNFVQGTDEWKAHRRTCDNASDAWSVMNDNPHKTRREFLKERATGVEKEFDDAAQARLDEGHKKEALAQPWAEEIIGESLFPMTMSDTIDGLHLSASFDGLTMLDEVAWEHKTLNKEIEEHLTAGRIPSRYFWQMEQGLMISGAEKCLFMASNGTKESMLHAWYYPSPEVRKQLLAGWKQFHADLENYQHVEPVTLPVAASIDALPALMVQVEGKVLATNLDQFKEAAQTFIANIKTELVNDQDFADADKMTKFLKDGEDRLAMVKDQAIAQTQSIDQLFRAIDDISGQMRSKRLALEKLVKAEKENRRIAIINEACTAIATHINGLNRRLGGQWMPVTLVSAARFAEAIKGLKSLESMRDKVDGALAKAKIEANEIADRIDINRQQITVDGANYNYLVHDWAAVCTKEPEDFKAMMAVRIADHKATEAAKIAAAEAKGAAEAEAKLRAESEARIDLFDAPAVSREEKAAVVIAHQDEISEFMASREWGKDEHKVRAILVEFVKFQAERKVVT